MKSNKQPEQLGEDIWHTMDKNPCFSLSSEDRFI